MISPTSFLDTLTQPNCLCYLQCSSFTTGIIILPHKIIWSSRRQDRAKCVVLKLSRIVNSDHRINRGSDYWLLNCSSGILISECCIIVPSIWRIHYEIIRPRTNARINYRGRSLTWRRSIDISINLIVNVIVRILAWSKDIKSYRIIGIE